LQIVRRRPREQLCRIMVNECHLTETALINRICGQKFSCFRKSPQEKEAIFLASRPLGSIGLVGQFDCHSFYNLIFTKTILDLSG